MNNHYVYELIDPRNNLPFYVGKGQGSRCFWHVKAINKKNGSGNPYKDSVIKQIIADNHEVVIKLIQENMTEYDAYVFESIKTKEYGLRIENPSGLLTNLIHGGFGGSENFKWNDERRQKHILLMANNKINKGRKQSLQEKQIRQKSLSAAYETGKRIPTEKQLISLNQNGLKRTETTKQKMSEYASNRPEEHQQKISSSLKGRTVVNKGVYGVVKQSQESNDKRRITMLEYWKKRRNAQI